MLFSAWMCVSAANLQTKKTEVNRSWSFSSNEEEYASASWNPEVKATIDFPTGNDKLSQTVIKWMASCLGAKVKVYKSAETLIDAYVAQIQSGDSPDINDQFTISKVYETKTLVSYEIEGYEYSGGAHGMSYRYGVTFSKKDCKEMNKLLVKPKAKLNPLIKKGLKQYFKVKSDAALSECLFESNLNKLELPNNSPWVVKEGIMFQYSAYEITAFMAGMPYVVIPVKQMQPYLTTEAKALFK